MKNDPYLIPSAHFAESSPKTLVGSHRWGTRPKRPARKVRLIDMLNHITLRVSDLERSKKFYTAALRPLGYRLLKEKSDSAGFGIKDVDGMRDFWIHKGGMAKEGYSFSCLAFDAPSQDAVEAFYKAGLAAGGTDNGAPGFREKYHPNYYAAFIHDPDGYNIEAVFDKPSK